MSALSTKRLESRREKITRANSVVFIAAAVASVLVMASLISVRFLWDKKNYNDRVITAKTEARDTIKSNLVNLEELAKQFPSLESDAYASPETILHALPPVYDYAGLASSVSKLASDAGVRFTGSIGEDMSASAVAKASTSTPLEIPVTLKVEGGYDATRRFIRNLELSIRPFNISNIEYSGTSGNLSVSVTATTYYQPTRTLDATKETIQ